MNIRQYETKATATRENLVKHVYLIPAMFFTSKKPTLSGTELKPLR